MSALACLRVMVRCDQTEHSEEVLGQRVAKFTTAFLEVRWSWPRKFSTINPYAFLLNDPQAAELDIAELGRLSAELHAHLLGMGETGVADVTVLLFEGDDPAMAQFAELSEARLTLAMTDASAAPQGGRLSRITPDGRRLRLPPVAGRPDGDAAVYDVPRAPSFQALKQLRDALDAQFSAIDLRTHDPAFEIEQLTAEAVTSVTLVLPQAEPERRLIVLRRFIARIEAYKRRRIWPGVTHIRTRRELDVALEAKVPFLTGPGICRPQIRPLGGRPWPIEQLPVPSTLVSPPPQIA